MSRKRYSYYMENYIFNIKSSLKMKMYRILIEKTIFSEISSFIFTGTKIREIHFLFVFRVEHLEYFGLSVSTIFFRSVQNFFLWFWKENWVRNWGSSWETAREHIEWIYKIYIRFNIQFIRNMREIIEMQNEINRIHIVLILKKNFGDALNFLWTNHEWS